ncbi:hypothetical protein Tco_1337285 [Tanacetum coccineum]
MRAGQLMILEYLITKFNTHRTRSFPGYVLRSFPGHVLEHEGDMLTLMSARNFFFFSRTRSGKDSVLCVLNFVTMYSRIINCTASINGFQFARRREDIKLFVFAIENQLTYEIVACVLARPKRVYVPVMCVYSSTVEDWVIMQEAESSNYYGGDKVQDHRTMYLMNLPFGDAYYITMNKEGSLFNQNPSFQR